jgi:hypothetical protein
MMIVRTVQQEDDCSWQDACNAWAGQDEEVVVGIHQVGVDREASEQAAVGQCKGARTVEGGEKSSELEDLLVDGEEQEYFLELLMRRASPDRLEKNPPTRSETPPPRARRARAKERKPDERTCQRRQPMRQQGERGQQARPAAGRGR